MSYAVASALQTAIYQALSTDPGVIGLVGTDVYDAVPAGVVPSTYVSLGPEIVVAASDKSDDGAEHRFSVAVVTDVEGFSGAKSVAVAVSDALHEADLPLARGTLVSLRFSKAIAKRFEDGTGRRIELTFRARVEDN